MAVTEITVADLISRYADDVAYVAEETPAADLNTFIDQLDTAAQNYSLAGLHGYEDVETAAAYLGEASSDETTRNVFLHRADALLAPVVSDMTEEYRDMVGD